MGSHIEKGSLLFQWTARFIRNANANTIRLLVIMDVLFLSK